MTTPEEEIAKLKAEIEALKQNVKELKLEIELQWNSHLEKDKEIRELQEKQRKDYQHSKPKFNYLLNKPYSFQLVFNNTITVSKINTTNDILKP